MPTYHWFLVSFTPHHIPGRVGTGRSPALCLGLVTRGRGDFSVRSARSGWYDRRRGDFFIMATVMAS